MKLKHKTILIFTIVYWLVIMTALFLFSFSFSKVQLGHVSLLGNQYTGYIQPNYFQSGFYNKGLGTYFISFPMTKVVKKDILISTMNKNMYKIQALYTLVYRINPNQVFNLYSNMRLQYQERLISSINSIISNVIMGSIQSQTRVTLQSQIITNIKAASQSSLSTSKLFSFKNIIAIQAFWLTQINFPQDLQTYYSFEAFQDSSAYSTSYVSTQIQLQKALMKIQTVKGMINNTQSKFKEDMKITYKQNFDLYRESQEVLSKENLVKLNSLFSTSRVFRYYQPSKINFT